MTPELAAARRRGGRSRRLLAPALAAAAVAATVAGIGATQGWFAGSDGSGTARPAAAGGAPSQPDTTQVAPTAGTGLPTTSAELAARARAILGDLASITVVDEPADPGPVRIKVGENGKVVTGTLGPVTPTRAPGNGDDGESGAAIHGTLTAAGRSGGFDLNVFQVEPGTDAATYCQSLDTCTTRTLPGGALAIDTWRNPNSAGITYGLNYVRADGTDVLMHLSNQADPKGAGSVDGTVPPLTVDQLTSFVTSDLW